MFTILLCKFLSFIGAKLGRGSSLPGAIALKLDKKILGRIKMPPLVIAVTGSNGKTSLTELIRVCAESAGLRVVSNSEGSNQTEGVTTALLKSCNLKKEVVADVAVLESDERFCQYTFKYFTPDYIVVTNLFRDQLTRNGNSEFVLGEMKKGLPADAALVLNADEPLSASLAVGRARVLWYGVDPGAYKEKEGRRHAYNDGAYCPLCRGRMKYDWHIFNHLGSFVCSKCGYKHPAPDHAVTGEKDDAFLLDKRYTVRPQLLNSAFAYNIAAAFTTAVEVLAMDPQAAADALTDYHLSNERVREFSIDGHKGLFMLSKHENSMSYDNSLNTIVNADSREMTVVIIVDLLSRKYIANDMSWLWDIDFQLLCDERVKRVLVGGAFANDVACRLTLSGVREEILTVKPDLDEMMASLYENPVGDIYVMTCFTDVGKFISRLK
ncbi:MAG: MurT ligase domain-containing protein [Oscillospiraceae bacterium]|nr:MurT ligase domain-containing protein [Oscillospiraceae bacterium]